MVQHYSQAVIGAKGFCFTDIIDSTQLWENDSEAMLQALLTHNRILRDNLAAFNGVEVKHTGDGFFLVFPNATNAVSFCLDILKKFHATAWSQEICNFRRQKDAAKNFVRKNPGPVDMPRRGLSIRMGLHYGRPYYTEVTPIVDYFGPVINVASRVQNESEGDELAVSDDVVEALRWEYGFGDSLQEPMTDALRAAILKSLDPTNDFRALIRGPTVLKGVSAPQYISMLRIVRK